MSQILKFTHHFKAFKGGRLNKKKLLKNNSPFYSYETLFKKKRTGNTSSASINIYGPT